jgi:NADP-dependent alcohol dehydrogenase
MTAPSADFRKELLKVSDQSSGNCSKVLADDFNYDAAGNFMWCCTMALNG